MKLLIRLLFPVWILPALLYMAFGEEIRWVFTGKYEFRDPFDCSIFKWLSE